MPAERRPDSEDHPFLSRAAAADLADVSEATIDRWRNKGLPSSKIGGRVLIERGDLLDWIRRHGIDTATLALAAFVLLQLLCALALLPSSFCEFLHDLHAR